MAALLGRVITADWSSAGIALLATMDRSVDSGLSLVPWPPVARASIVHNTSAQSALVGMQGLFIIEQWDGFSLTA